MSSNERNLGEIRDVIGRLSAAWQARRYDELRDYFHDSVVIVAPGFQARVEGREACVASYREFMERVTIQRYSEAEPVLAEWGNTAVATYRWEMSWTSGDVPNQEAGHDILVLVRTQSDDTARWHVAWRTTMPDGTRK